MQKQEYATLEWLWDSNQLRINYSGCEEITKGSYAEVIATLNKLGETGWQVCACVSGGNWLFWTLNKIRQ